MTENGESLFLRLRTAAMTFHSRLCTDVSDEDLAVFTSVLQRMDHNATSDDHTPNPHQAGGH